jgi:orotate phosphoribosyltransferase
MNSPVTDNQRKAAKALISTKSVLCQSAPYFTFTSGKKSPVYVDCRRLISFPAERSMLMDMAAQQLIDNVGLDNIDYVAGGETAGIPYAAFVAERLNKPMLYVRKQPKGFGRNAQIEGNIEGDSPKVVLIEDLQTDGGSKKVFIDALRAANCTVEHSLVVFHYGIFPASLANMKAAGVELHSLTDWWAVLEEAKAGQYFDEQTLSDVEAFLNAPEAWQDAHPPEKAA